MLRYAAAAATALTLLTGLSACGSQDPPVAKPRPTRTATSPAPSPSPTPPALPAAARANTKAGAKAFVRHYIELINYAQATGDLKPLKARELPGCKSCKSVAQYSNSIYSRGGHIEGGAWRARIFAANRDRVHNGWVVDAIVKFGPQKVVHPNGKAQRLKGGSLPMSFFLHGTQTGWGLAEWTRGR